MKEYIVTHEKIIIVALAYIIGFTTAFIGFGLTQDSYKHHRGDHKYHEDRGEYSDRDHYHDDDEDDDDDDHDDRDKTSSSVNSSLNLEASVITAMVSEDGFYVDINGNQRIISANTTSENQPGYHHAIPEYHVSPNNAFIFYCEQQTEVPTICFNYIFDIQSDAVYPVSVDGEHLETEIAGETAIWLTDGRLMVNGYISDTAAAPWKVSIVQ